MTVSYQSLARRQVVAPTCALRFYKMCADSAIYEFWNPICGTPGDAQKRKPLTGMMLAQCAPRRRIPKLYGARDLQGFARGSTVSRRKLSTHGNSFTSSNIMKINRQEGNGRQKDILKSLLYLASLAVQFVRFEFVKSVKVVLL